MAEVKIDTTKMRETGEAILKLVDELKSNYEDLFTRLDNVTSKTFEWVGPTAEDYFNTVKKDKPEFMIFANNLYKYGKFLIDSSNEFEYTINNIKR